jgi:hypothetical protein
VAFTFTYDGRVDLLKSAWESIPAQPNMTYDTGPIADSVPCPERGCDVANTFQPLTGWLSSTAADSLPMRTNMTYDTGSVADEPIVVVGEPTPEPPECS